MHVLSACLVNASGREGGIFWNLCFFVKTCLELSARIFNVALDHSVRFAEHWNLDRWIEDFKFGHEPRLNLDADCFKAR